MSVSDVLIELDPATGVSYFVLDEADVATTVHVSNLVSVDLAIDGHPVGVEFLRAPHPAHDDWMTLFGRFPELKETLGHFAV